MKLSTDTGLLDQARYIASPNCDERPDPDDIDALVIHAISLPPDEFGGDYIEHLFTNCLDPAAHPYFEEICGLNVSAHFLIRRDGALIQFVPTHLRAWHAGRSELNGREELNDFSVGIELEGCDTMAFDDNQYQVLSQLVNAIRETYPAITGSRIVGHSDVAPGRKTDPGPCFDWSRFRRMLDSV
jgi:AmpD protein